MKSTGVLAFSPMAVNYGFSPREGCSGKNANIILSCRYISLMVAREELNCVCDLDQSDTKMVSFRGHNLVSKGNALRTRLFEAKPIVLIQMPKNITHR